MKIIDENGAAIETPDLTLGYLVDDTEPVEHPAVEGVEEVSHYETVTEYPGGGRDVRKVIDVPGVTAQAAWTEQVPVQRYIRYTEEELAAQEEARKKAEAREKLPETVLFPDEAAAVLESREALPRLLGRQHIYPALLADNDHRPVLQNLHGLADGLRRDVILA